MPSLQLAPSRPAPKLGGVKPQTAPKLGLGRNDGGMQGGVGAGALQPATGGGKLQPAAGANVVQPAAGAPRVQNGGGTRQTQPAVDNAAIQRAAEETRRRAEAEAERIRIELARIKKEEDRRRVQGQLDAKVAEAKSGLQLTVRQNPTPKIKGVVTAKPVRLDIKPQSAEEKAYADAYWQAYNDVESRRKSNKKGIGKLWDKLTFGQDDRDRDARDYAAKRLEELSQKGVKDFEDRVNRFTADQAKRKAGIEGARFSTREDFDRAVADYDNWQTSEIAALQKGMASFSATADAYDKASSAKLTSTAARAVGSAVKAVQSVPGLNKVWQYTLGSGDKNIPSLVTAPSRIINTIGNLNTQDRDIYRHGGTQTKRGEGVVSAWQASHNQRNFNIRPWTDVQFDAVEAEKRFGEIVTSYQNAQRQMGKQPSDRGQLLQEYWNNDNSQHRKYNSVLELLADPLFLASGVTKTTRFGQLTDKVKTSVTSNPIFRSIADSPAVKWLNAEAKSPGQRLSEAIDSAKVKTDGIQHRYLGRINDLNRKLSQPGTAPDTSVLNEMARLTNYEAKVLQRTRNGQLARRDRLILAGARNAPIRDRITDLARRTTDWTEQMKLTDGVRGTRFGAGKRFYAPRTGWVHSKGLTLDEYDFRLRKRVFRSQDASDLHRSFVDRYFKSSVDDIHVAAETDKQARRVVERKRLIEKYDEEMTAAKAEAQGIYDKHKWRIKAARFSPTRLWKASVLKYRPAWYVNNVGYNTQAAMLAGGVETIPEQLRLLRPTFTKNGQRHNNYIDAVSDLPLGVKSDIQKEIGSDRLGRFGSRVENVPRVAAFNTLKKRGYSDADALKRVDKYLFNYQIKNWERPLRAVMPFWSWQKNLTRAATEMPLDRPGYAVGYNRLDKLQQKQFDDDFQSITPELLEMGYTEEEVQAIKEQNQKYFTGRIRVGGRYFTTPFNAFSEKGLSNMSVNPYFAAAGESANAEDQFGRPLKGNDASLTSRLISKFPQAQIAKEVKSRIWDNPRYQPQQQYIGEPGSEGYGMTKVKQGYDPTKINYNASLDKSSKLLSNIGAFFGLPRSLKFDGDDLLRRKALQKATDEYFSTDWKQWEYEERTRRQTDMFEKYGLTADQFFNGELSKYDSENTTRLKKMRSDARAQSDALFAEYQRQPRGTRKVWATQKLKELVDSGYFDNNPFLASFDWLTPELVQSAYKTIAYRKAKESGDWSAYHKAYGDKRRNKTVVQHDGRYFKNGESRDRYVAGKQKKAFWERYYAEPDLAKRRQLIADNPQYSKVTGDKPRKPRSDESIFWENYVNSDRQTRRRLIADNPQYNKRRDWTADMWDEQRATDRTKLRTRTRSLTGFVEKEQRNRLINEILARPVIERPRRQKNIRISLR